MEMLYKIGMPGSEVHIANKEVAVFVWDLWEIEPIENINI